jgi:hypothetical protein
VWGTLGDCRDADEEDSIVSAEGFGPIEWTCYNHCRFEGCPGHKGQLWEKHGGYYVEEEDGTRWDLGADIFLVNAIARVLVTAHTQP